jgi:hypothetical protein
MQYDLFLSYSRKDNLTNRVTELKDKIEADYLEFAEEELKCFFDKDEIKGMEDWKQRLLQGLKDSHLLLLILSPNYLESPYCEWEIVEYLKYEYARATQGDGVAQIYFMEIPGLDGPGFAEKAKVWIEKLSRRQRFDFRPWYNDGADSLKETDVKTRLEELKKSLHDRIQRMRRIANTLGNLPAPNARFVGREHEMKLLHESVGLGKFGGLTAVHGLGGLGKTAIAFQYAYVYADFYPGGRWHIGCSNETNLAVVLKKLDIDLKVTFTEDEKRDDIRGAKRIINELEALAFKVTEAHVGEKKFPKPATLLLLDNVDRAELIQPPNSALISGKEWLKVLITTRMGLEELGIDETKQTMVTIEELPFYDALSLIESYQPGGRFKNEEEKEYACEIVKLLECFTLAVEVAALYLYERKGQISCAAFLDLLKRMGSVSGIDLAGTKTKTVINHTKLISATLSPTLEILSPAETLILDYASLLPPDTIPVLWLKAMIIKEYPELGIVAEAGLDDQWITILNHLLSLQLLHVSMIKENDGCPIILRMHRLIQDSLQKRNKENNSIQQRFNIFISSIEDGLLKDIGSILIGFCNSYRHKPVSIILFGSYADRTFDLTFGAFQRICSCSLKKLIFDLNDFHNSDELLLAFEQINSATSNNFIPVVFWKNFDSKLKNQDLGWLRLFLIPMQDSIFCSFDSGKRIEVVPAFYVFSTNNGDNLNDTESFVYSLSHNKMVGQFKDDYGEMLKAKVPDFFSRLNGWTTLIPSLEN